MIAIVLANLGWRAISLDDYTEAKRFLEESLTLHRALGDRWGVAMVLPGSSSIARLEGELEEAESLARESITIHQEMGHRGGYIITARTVLVKALGDQGKFAEAHALAQENLARGEEIGPRTAFLWPLLDLAFSNLHLGHYEQARALAQSSLVQSREASFHRQSCSSLAFLGRVALAREAYPEVQQFLQQSIAHLLEIDEQVNLSHEQGVLAYAFHAMAENDQARRLLHEALRKAVEIKAFQTLVSALPVMALVLADEGEPERAVELYALSSRYGLVANSRWFEDVAGKQILAVAETLPPEVVAAAQERGRARDLWATAEELLAEFEGQVAE